MVELAVLVVVSFRNDIVDGFGPCDGRVVQLDVRDVVERIGGGPGQRRLTDGDSLTRKVCLLTPLSLMNQNIVTVFVLISSGPPIT